MLWGLIFLFLIVLALIVLGKIFSFVFRLAAVILLFGIIYYGIMSFGLVTPSAIKNVVAKPAISLIAYDKDTKNFSYRVGNYIVNGQIGSKQINIMRDGKVVKTVELPEPAEIKGNEILSADVLQALIKQ